MVRGRAAPWDGNRCTQSTRMLYATMQTDSRYSPSPRRRTLQLGRGFQPDGTLRLGRFQPDVRSFRKAVLVAALLISAGAARAQSVPQTPLGEVPIPQGPPPTGRQSTVPAPAAPIPSQAKPILLSPSLAT